MGQVLALRRNEDAEVWVTLAQFCSDLAPLLDGHRPTERWARYRIAEGLPSDKFLGRRMVPRDRGIGWLRQRGFIP